MKKEDVIVWIVAILMIIGVIVYGILMFKGVVSPGRVIRLVHPDMRPFPFYFM